MADNKLARGSFSTLTCTLGGLANSTAGVGRRSTPFDNSSGLFKDLEFEVKLTGHATTGVSATGFASIYIYQSADGSLYETGASTDAGYTVVAGSLLTCRPLPIVAVNTAYTIVFKYSEVAGVYAPYSAGLVIVNSSGAALHATDGNHTIRCRGLYETVS